MSSELGPVLFKLLAATHRLSRSAVVRLDHGLSASHYRTLGILRDVRSMRIGQLAEQNRISQPGMTKIVASLEAQGLVERVQDDADSRAWLIEITDTGRQTLIQRGKDLAAVLKDDFNDLTEEQIAVLAKAAEILDSKPDKASAETK
ncbi:MarR family winged helix-turn-helix transcriptional regulator [Paeniglutamicibacter sp. ORCA_105]|jgi:DNA-binding MarR family transcriptional regulator|uniref:MarR family winged helix-turn-helix transcriptional regulator n=1 Tax=Paeniglutamicibacter sp. ORCA_105 TaxID=3377336 RepID=UPI003893A787